MLNHFFKFFQPEASLNSAALYQQGMDLIELGEKTKNFSLFNNGMSLLMKADSEASLNTIKDILGAYGLKSFSNDFTAEHLKKLNAIVSQRHFNEGRIDQLAFKEPTKIPRS